MDIKTCRVCGKLFQSRGNAQCPECLKIMDEKFVSVRNYIFDNPNANMPQICEDNDVDEDTVMRWIREGRLIASSNVLGLKCISCGKPIGGGRYCPACNDQMKNQLDEAARDMRSAIARNEKKGIHTESLRRKQ